MTDHSVNQKTADLLNGLRRDIIKMAEHSGHVGVALSCIDILAALYAEVMNCTPAAVESPGRDRFVLSKGHGCMALYAVLAQMGFIDRQVLATYGHNGSILAEHPIAGKVTGVECATGTLGHGLAIGAGMAAGIKLQGLGARVFVLLGDGECNEGSVWEAAALASTDKLDNLVAIVDCNGLQACGACDEVSPAVRLADCWKGFGWEVEEADGHDYRELVRTLGRPATVGKPRVVLCRTVKGRGVNFMEGDLEWHYRPVQGDDREEALKGLADA
ncbi:transketolase [Geobacter sp. AOG2]|uniref:transketolase n=1 Tax=Geobacter sp. AOG2 TaxID=1566347 RepID=UPI001CC40EBF|nr:transketolase [Geobacter sp. AOG2]GFE62156.1 transketolase, N-terminal subunit [Geobacter sp. AOG2]